MKKYYYVQQEIEDDEFEIVNSIGIFSTKKKAEEAIKNIKSRIDYKKQKKERFNIDKIIIDQIDWSEGYIND